MGFIVVAQAAILVVVVYLLALAYSTGTKIDTVMGSLRERNVYLEKEVARLQEKVDKLEEMRKEVQEALHEAMQRRENNQSLLVLVKNQLAEEPKEDYGEGVS